MKHSPLLLHNSNFSKVLIFIGIALLSLGLFSVLSILAARFIYDIPLTDLALIKDSANPKIVEVLKMMQLMQALGLFIVPPFIFAFIDSTNVFEYLMLHKKPLFYSGICTVLLMLCAQPLINWMAELNGLMPAPDWMLEAEKNAAEVTKVFLKMDNAGTLFINLFVIAFLPALGEELLFRGVIQNLFQKTLNRKHLSIWLSAILFSALHMQFLGFFPRMFIGAALGYLLVWSGSLWLPVIAHFTNNAGAVLISFFVQKKGMDKELETVGSNQGQTLYVIVSTLLVIILIYSIRKNENQTVIKMDDYGIN